jgi:hypothetical protein
VLAGTLAAYLHVYAGRAALFAPVLRGWAVLAPGLELVPRFDVGVLGAIAAAGILLPLAGTLLAAHRPASGDPDAVIRQ